MNTYIYIYIYICICVYVYIYIYTYIHTHTLRGFLLCIFLDLNYKYLKNIYKQVLIQAPFFSSVVGIFVQFIAFLPCPQTTSPQLCLFGNLLLDVLEVLPRHKKSLKEQKYAS